MYFYVTDKLQYIVVGMPYSYSFCSPRVETPSDICGKDEQFEPSGGNPPYHFQLGTGGGFPPMGMTLHPNGLLEGTPTTVGTSKFTVCAVDLAGTQSCNATSLEVKDVGFTFDSLTCENLGRQNYPDNTPDILGFRITAKGTMKGAKDFGLLYWEDRGGIDKTKFYTGSEELACGTWMAGSGIQTFYPDKEGSSPICKNDNDVSGTTSWTLVLKTRSDVSSFNLKSGVAMQFLDIDSGLPFGSETTPVTKEVMCS